MVTKICQRRFVRIETKLVWTCKIQEFNLYHVQFSWQLSVFCNAIFSLRILSQLKLYRSFILIQFLTMLKLALLCWKISRLLLLKELWEENIKVSRKLDLFVEHRCLWPQQSPYGGKHSALHEYSLLFHFHNSYSGYYIMLLNRTLTKGFDIIWDSLL